MSNYLKRLFFCFAILLAVFLLSVASIKAENKKTITIGSKIESENSILAEILRLLIEKQTDLTVYHVPNLEGTWVCFNALQAKDIDLYIEFSGTVLSTILKADLNEDDVFIRREFAKRYDVAWLETLGFENSYALFSKDGQYQKFSQLKDPSVCIGVDPEFAARKECELLKNAYDPHFEMMDQDLLFISPHTVIVAASTDARTRGFHRLYDDDQLFPSYRPAPLVRNAVLKCYPELKEVLLSCKNFITKEEICRLNMEVDLNHKNPYDVALDYLKSKGFL